MNIESVHTMIYGTSDKDISLAADILRNGGLVAIPTETVYGLAANALDPKAVASIFAAKGRPADNPLIVHICDIAQLDEIACPTPAVRALAEKFWPGPLTMIMPKKSVIPSIVSAGLDTVAVRFPSHPVAQRLIRESGVPLAAPSANKSGKPSATKASHVEEDYEGKIPVVDAGECACGVESTVVSLVNNPPVLLRPGFITPAMLRTVVPDLVVADAVLHELKENEKVLSPGLKHRHYAPDAETICVSGSARAAVKTVGLMTPSTMRACVICYDEETSLYKDADIIPYGHENDEAELASHVFDALREADSRHYDRIYVRTRLSDGVGLAVYNRLLRACGFHVVHADDTPFLVGVTGPSGSGKSVFCDIAAEYGYEKTDADKIYTDILPSLLPSLAKAFGSHILNADSTLNRKALAAEVFANEEKIKTLNELTHPAVLDEIKRRILASPSRRFAVEAIGLIETGFGTLCDKTVCVCSDEAERVNRIIARDNLTREQALKRIKAQKPTSYYTENCDIVIKNETLNKLKEDTIKILNQFTEEQK